MRGLSLVVASGGHSSSRCAGLSPSRPLLLRSTGSRCAGSVVVAHGPSCSVACGILPSQGSNPCPLHWQADSQPLRHQGSPKHLFLDPLSSFYLRSWQVDGFPPNFLAHLHRYPEESFSSPPPFSRSHVLFLSLLNIHAAKNYLKASPWVSQSPPEKLENNPESAGLGKHDSFWKCWCQSWFFFFFFFFFLVSWIYWDWSFLKMVR